MKKILSFNIICFLCGCGVFEVSKRIDYENVYDFKAQSDLYLLSKKPKKIKEFIEYSYHEKIAKQNVKKKCSDFLKKNNLKNAQCKFKGTKQTEKITTSLN